MWSKPENARVQQNDGVREIYKRGIHVQEMSLVPRLINIEAKSLIFE